MTVRIHAVEPHSRANGPGRRFVVWFQGCTRHCPGCFNPETHDPAGGYETDTEALANEILACAGQVEGVTFSGGEPFLQAQGLLDLLERLGTAPRIQGDHELTHSVFTGYTLEEIRALPLGQRVLSHVDVLVAGRYDQTKHLGRGLLGSANQRIHLLTDRHERTDFGDVPVREVIIHRDGSVTMSGVGPAQSQTPPQ